MAHATLAALRHATPDLWRAAAVAFGATGAAIAIAVMELLAEGSAIPLLFVPFATSIVLVMGLATFGGGNGLSAEVLGGYTEPSGRYAE